MTARRPLFGHVLAATMTLAMFAGESQASVNWTPTPVAVSMATRGQVFIEVVGEADNRTGVIRAVIDIAAPRERVWRAMTDCARVGVLMRNTTCRVVSGDIRSGSDVREQRTAGTMIFPAMTNVVRVDYVAPRLMRFRRAGGDFQTLEGEWRLESINGGAGTRVIYVNRLAVNLRLPPPLMREGMRRDVPRMLMNLRREAMSNR